MFGVDSFLAHAFANNVGPLRGCSDTLVGFYFLPWLLSRCFCSLTSTATAGTTLSVWRLTAGALFAARLGYKSVNAPARTDLIVME